MMENLDKDYCIRILFILSILNPLVSIQEAEWNQKTFLNNIRNPLSNDSVTKDEENYIDAQIEYLFNHLRKIETEI